MMLNTEKAAKATRKTSRQVMTTLANWIFTTTPSSLKFLKKKKVKPEDLLKLQKLNDNIKNALKDIILNTIEIADIFDKNHLVFEKKLQTHPKLR